MARPVETLAQRLKLARQQRKLSQIQLAEASGMKQGDISKIETGRIQQTTGIARLAAALGVSPLWLEMGEGAQPLWTDAQPLGTELGGGLDHALSDESATINPIQMQWELLLLSALPSRFSLIVRDEAMPPMRPGHRAIFDKADKAEPGDVVLIADRDDNLYIRMYRERRPGHWFAEAGNQGFAPLDSAEDGLRILAILAGCIWRHPQT